MKSRMDDVARAALNGILKLSIQRRKEYGGMIYRDRDGYAATEPRTQDLPTTVDVGVHEANHGCPEGTTPVAYYHTHPTYSVGGVKADFESFSQEDKNVASDNGLASAYVGTLDGSFLRYDVKLNKVTKLPGGLRNS